MDNINKEASSAERRSEKLLPNPKSRIHDVGVRIVLMKSSQVHLIEIYAMSTVLGVLLLPVYSSLSFTGPSLAGTHIMPITLRPANKIYIDYKGNSGCKTRVEKIDC
jgi:hypothetical protein